MIVLPYVFGMSLWQTSIEKWCGGTIFQFRQAELQLFEPADRHNEYSGTFLLVHFGSGLFTQ